MIKAQRIARYTLTSAFIISLLCLLGVFLSGPLYRLDLWSLGFAFDLLKWSVYICGVAALLVIINITINFIEHAATFNKANLLVIIICTLTVGIPYLYVSEFEKINTIADITTDLKDPPRFVDLIPAREKTARNPLEYRGGEATEAQLKFFPKLAGIKIKASVQEVIETAKAITQESGIALASAAPEQGRLEATETSLWYGFKDDVVIRAKALENGETLVDIRSASRVGYGDGGVNGKRVMMYLNELKRRLNN